MAGKTAGENWNLDVVVRREHRTSVNPVGSVRDSRGDAEEAGVVLLTEARRHRELEADSVPRTGFRPWSSIRKAAFP